MQSKRQRYVVRVEPLSDVHVHATRRMFEVVDQGTSAVHPVLERRFWRWGEAEKYARQKNMEHEHAVAVGAR
jgi:hypothetical protein